jgi:hypothetical protein
MKKIDMYEIDQLVQQAGHALADSQTILQELHENSSIVDVEMLQLILQYRLDTQDALIKLLQLDHGLLQALGISPQHPTRMNLERMEYALGNDDLHHVLYSLSQLVHSLLRIANRYQQHLEAASRQKQEQHLLHVNTMSKKLGSRFQKAVAQQTLFITLISTLQEQVEHWDRLEAIGPVLDHISALRGPISQFFQALQNGLEVSHQLYEKFNKDLKLDDTLDVLLEQSQFVLKHIPAMNQPSQFFTPVKIDTAERLEQRAATKRLGNFFNH